MINRATLIKIKNGIGL